MARANKKSREEQGIVRSETVTLGFFDSQRFGDKDLRLKHVGTPIDEVAPLTYDDYSPYGGTPLNDCALKFLSVIDKVAKDDPNGLHIGLLGDESGSMAHLRGDVVEGFNTFLGDIKNDPASGEPGVMVVIMTDGEENSSQEDRDGSKVSAAIKSKESEGWNFFYLGANQDAWQAGNNLGFGANTYSANFVADSGGTRGAFASASSAVNYRRGSSSALYAADDSAVMASIGAVKNTADDKADLWVPGKSDDEDDANGSS